MKKYLLLFLMCVYASIGAWADSNGTYCGSSTYAINGDIITITVNRQDELGSSQGSTTGAATLYEYKWPSSIFGDINQYSVIKFVTAKGVTLADGYNRDQHCFYMFSRNGLIIDLSEASLTYASETSAYINAENNSKNFILPNGKDPATFTSTASNNTFNKYSVSGSTVNVAYNVNDNLAPINKISSTATILKVVNDVSSAIDLSTAATGITTFDFTSISTVNNGSNTITVPDNVTVKASSQGVLDRVSGTNVTKQLAFGGVLSIENNTQGNLKTAIETAIGAYTGATESDITSLTITGQLNDADLAYIATLSNLTTLNLSGVTSTITSLSSTSLTNLTLPDNATTLPSNLGTNCPNISSAWVCAKSDNTISNIEIYTKSAGYLTGIINEIKSSKNNNNDLTWSVSNATVKISGALNSTDKSVIRQQFVNAKILDLTDATGFKASDLEGHTGHEVIKLPKGTEMPDETLAASLVGRNGGNGPLLIYSLSTNGRVLSIWEDNVGRISGAITGNNAIGGYTDVQYALIKGRASLNLTNDETALTNNKINIARDPISYNGCAVTINKDFATDSMSDLITEAEKELNKSSINICTLKVTGELTTNDLESLDDAETATSIDLSEATVAAGAINSLQVPSKLESLVLPQNQTVKGTALANTLSAVNSLMYAYSPTSDAGATVPDYVWVNQGDGLNAAYKAETPLLTSIYIKVAANDNTLTATDMDMRNANILGESGGLSNLAFLDLSEAGLTPEISATYKCPDKNGYTGYRIILPNNRTGDQMAIYATNTNVGSIAAVYSYTGTELNILEINDGSYSPAALADGRIMRSNTTQVNIVSGFNSGETKGTFGPRLLAALNNMGKSNFSVTTKNAQNEDVTTDYTNTVGLNVTKIVVDTRSAMPTEMKMDNPTIQTLEITHIVPEQNNTELNVDACSSLTTLNITGSLVKSIDASNTALTTVNLSGSVVGTTTDFSNSSLETLTTTDETSFNGAVNLTNTKLTSFETAARIGGDISLNGTSTLKSINVTAATFTNTTSKIHIDESTTEDASNEDIIANLKQSGQKTILLPSGFDAENRIHPYAKAKDYIEITAPVVAAVTYAASDMVFHDAETTGDKFRYWYQETETAKKIATVGTSATRTLHDVIAGGGTESVAAHADLTSDAHVMIKVVGTMKANDLDSLKYLNATAIDLSDAVIEEGVLAARLKNANILHTNTKFLILPDTCSREHILNKATLSKQTGVYSVIAINTTDEGRDLTSWSKVSGALQPAVVIAGKRSCQSWTKTPDGKTSRNIYTSDISNFKDLKISGLINAYDLSKSAQKVTAEGHLIWKEAIQEVGTQKRTIAGDYTVSGPFGGSFTLTEIDLRDAYFEEVDPDAPDTEWKRYYFEDMTLSYLDIISTATRKVVIPEDSRVKEVPADFMNCSTNIRAICIPSNIRAIRTRAFYTIDYVWTTKYKDDPEGDNTRLDNGAVYSGSTDPVYATAAADFSYTAIPTGGTYTFGSHLKVIETAAFANTQPHVSDVYVLNTIAPECHVDAFNTVMYVGNGGYSPVITDGIITRDSYQNNGFWITMLHYPRQTTDPQIQRYTDPTREYSIATGERDGKGAIIYFPNQSEFNRAYNQGTYGYTWNGWDPTRLVNNSVADGGLNVTQPWSKEGQATANTLYTNNPLDKDKKKFYSFYDVSLGGNTKPEGLVDYYKVNWNPSTYKYSEVDRKDGLAGNLYPKSEKDDNSDIDGSGEETSKDYRGWHQFVLNAYAANTILEEEPYRSYITDNEWWTIVPEFDITRSEAAILFGKSPVIDKNLDKPSYPYVSKLKYVRRNYADESINLCFTGDLTTLYEERQNDNDKHGMTNQYGVMNPSGEHTWNADDVVMKSGVPYLIKPAFAPGAIRQFRIFNTQKDLGEYLKANKESNVIAFYHENLYKKLHDSQIVSGNDQMADVKAGVYIVPAFASEANKDGITKENIDATKHWKIGDIQYYVSADWCYAFVGTFYKSFLPHFSYFLGWDSSKNCAKFYYHNGNFDTIDKEMRWANGTGVIVPIKKSALENGAFPYSVTPAKEKDPAQWKLQTAFDDDSYVLSSSGASSVKAYNMIFDAPDITPSDSDVTGISNVETEDSNILDNVNVYSVNGQKVGTSLEGLPKGIYIVNGKKFIVK